MQEKNKARLTELCEEAAKEQDAARLLELVKEINRMVEAKSSGFEAADNSSIGMQEPENEEADPR